MNKQNTVVPTIIEKSGGGNIGYDIFSKLLKERTIMVGAERYKPGR